MKSFNTKLLSLCALTLAAVPAFAQTAFYNANSRLVTPAFHSGCSVTVIDVNNDGLDDIVRLAQGHDLYLEIQNGSGQFEERHIGDMGGGSAWGMCVADVDHNGWKDVLSGGGTTRIMKISDDGMSGTLYTMPSGSFFMQNANFMDVNNDGWADVFACDDNAPAHIWLNDGAGNFAVSNIINFAVHPGSTSGGDPWDSGNYGSVWSDVDNDGDIDLHIAKCRQSTGDFNDPRRIDVLFLNNGNGTFTEDAASRGLADSDQTWTTNFADWDNDGDLDAIKTEENTPPHLLQNDGTGHFTDATAGSGFSLDVFPIESVMEDFDNDGFVDILVSGDDARFFHNNGNGTFTQLTGLFDSGLESFAIGDLNHDGFVDVYASYANIYTTPTSDDDIVYLNHGNGNHFFNLNLRGTVSNPDAIGARAFIYGPWGVQLRENHSGESYGTANSLMLHFGLGTADAIDSVVIKWPSGISQTILNPAADQFLTVIENDCISPTAQVSADGPLLICPGQTLDLSAPAGYAYLWSNGATAQQISVGQTGEYFVQITAAGNNCTAVSPAVTVVTNPDETPVVVAPAVTTTCAGGGIELQGPPGLSSYLWSNGATTQNTTATASGSYTLTTQGTCQPYTSSPVTVTILPANQPVASNDTVNAPGGSVTLTASGDSILWYAAPNGGTPIATGDTYTTPTLTSTTTYYVENLHVYLGTAATGGLAYPSGNSLYSGSSSTNAKMTFDVLDSATLVSFHVYTDHPGTRVIQLFDAANNLLNSASVNITGDSMLVVVNFPLAPGTGYYLTTDATVNLQIPNWNAQSPRLQRNINNLSYPYNVGSLLSITGSDQGNNVYYYFYDWLVKANDVVCASNRVPVEVFYNTDIAVPDVSQAGVSLYPNPANDVVHVVSSASFEGSRLSVYDVTGRRVFETVLDQRNVQTVNTAAWSAGLYTVKLENNGNAFVSKLVLQR